MKNLISAMVAGFVVQLAGLFLIHSVWLKEDYIDTAATWRTWEAAQARTWAMILGTAIYIVGAVLIYVRGREAKPWIGQGLRFGVFIGTGERCVWLAERLGDSASAAPVGGEMDGGGECASGGTGIGDRQDLPNGLARA